MESDGMASIVKAIQSINMQELTGCELHTCLRKILSRVPSERPPRGSEWNISTPHGRRFFC